MDQKLYDMKLKQYFAEYEYLELELTTTMYQFEIYRKKFVEEFYGGNIPIEEIKPKPETDTSIEETVTAPVQEPSPILKKMYKVLSLKTHPDKTGGDDRIFVAVKKAYNEGNIFKLLNIATKLNIELEDITKDRLELYELKIKETREQIEQYKKRTAWVWAFANDEIKALIRKTL